MKSSLKIETIIHIFFSFSGEQYEWSTTAVVILENVPDFINIFLNFATNLDIKVLAKCIRQTYRIKRILDNSEILYENQDPKITQLLPH